jgi:6-phosphogluconate dehydrogenase
MQPAFKTLAQENGSLYCGPAGAGHFVKMVHNGIEYGMMQAYGEGFEILKSSRYMESLNLADVARLWNHGSVVRSWLLELAEEVFEKDAGLDEIEGYVEDSGEGRWVVQEAVDSGVAAPVMALSLMQRFSSRNKNSFSDKFLAALRQEFGGHPVVPVGEKPQA